MFKLTKIQFFKILILYTLLALTAVFCYNIKKIFAPAKKRAFQCSDESLAKPFVDDTVPPKQLHMLGVYFPLVLIAVGEFISSLAARPTLKHSSWILRYSLKSIIILTLFLIGLAAERLYKNVAKIKMARLRPNFITVCKPVNADGATCLHGDRDTFIMDEYECSSNEYPSWAVSTAFASFPSGHTSLTSYSMIFVIYYLHLLSLKLRNFQNSSTLVILIMQALCFFTIVFVGMSRVLDFRHHWSDVCAGFIGGSCIALALSYYLHSQLENIEDWLKDLAGHTEKDVESAPTAYGNKSNNEKTASYAMEMVSE